MDIKAIIFEDGTKEEFKFEIPEGFENFTDYKKHLRIRYARIQWEQKKVFHHLSTDLEDYAKDEFDLIDADDKDDLSEYTDEDILCEAEKRRLHLNNVSIENENIINQNFLSRFAEIINRGNDIEIDEFLDTLEKKYHIK